MLILDTVQIVEVRAVESNRRALHTPCCVSKDLPAGQLPALDMPYRLRHGNGSR